MKIVLCCNAGLSTTMLMDSIKKTIKGSSKLNEEDFSLIAIPADLLSTEIDDAGVVVVGPQIAHKLDQIKSVCEPINVPYVLVSQETFGLMDGATVLKQALIARKKADM